MKYFCKFLFHLLLAKSAHAQNVGIGTSTPQARLHVTDSSVLFSTSNILFNNATPPPISGPGSRMMWYAARSAFRAGATNGDYWNEPYIGYFSFAGGYNTRASGDYSTAMGYLTVASGNSSVAMGSHATAAAPSSISLGYESEAAGNYSVALGNYATASGIASVALGNVARAEGFNAVAIGSGTRSLTLGQVTLGTNNELHEGQAGSWIATDPLFVVGNGGSSSARSTAMTILKNGNTGIGTKYPTAKLHVSGNLMIGTGTPQANLHVEGMQIIRRNSYTGAPHLVLEETQSGDGARLQFRTPAHGAQYWDVYGLTDASNSAEATFNIYYSPVGDAMRLRGNGNVFFRGSVSQNSDARLKKDIEPLQHSAEKLEHLHGYSYHWKNEKQDQQWQTGLLAQEVELVLPELVSTDAQGIKSVNYIALIPHLIETINSLQKRIKTLEAKN